MTDLDRVRAAFDAGALLHPIDLDTPGAGHLAELERPDIICALIGDFVTSGKVAQLTAWRPSLA